MSIAPQRVYSRASAFRPASRAVWRMISIWIARSWLPSFPGRDDLSHVVAVRDHRY
jgi:hypothetical protein